MSDGVQSFSKLRSFLFPIYNREFKKFFAFTGIYFCMLMNYTFLRNMKDVLVLNAAGAGVITFLKTYCVTPAGVLFFILFVKLSNIFSREKLFYVIIIPFLAYFLVFGFVINPNFELFHPSKEVVEALHQAHPHSQGFIDIVCYWSYSLFYILARKNKFFEFAVITVGIVFQPEIKNILESKDRQKAGKTLPAQGLFLMNVNYE